MKDMIKALTETVRGLASPPEGGGAGTTAFGHRD